MSKSITTEVLPENLLEHRAVQAWTLLKPERVEPEDIQILKLKNKSAVYRLAGVGPLGTAIIAKRCLTTTARIERMIHEQFLARLPIQALRCYGFVDEPAGQYCWLFLEEAVGERYSPLNGQHRELAGRWLATIHTAALEAGLADRLPARETSHYLRLLQATSYSIQEHAANPVLFEDDVQALQAMAAHCATVQSHWSELEQACDGWPRTLVHGDFVAKNVRVRSTPKGLAFLAFDWEVAGWGVPATDVAQFTGSSISPDLRAYTSATECCRGDLEIAAVERLAWCGKFFRLIDDIYWASSLLTFNSYEFLEKPVSYLKRYEPWVAEALLTAGWKE